MNISILNFRGEKSSFCSGICYALVDDVTRFAFIMTFDLHFNSGLSSQSFLERSRERDRGYMSDDRQQMASSRPPDMEITTTPSPGGKESTVSDRLGQKRDRSPDSEHTSKSKKTTHMSHERIGVQSPDYASGAGTLITCKYLLLWSK